MRKRLVLWAVLLVLPLLPLSLPAAAAENGAKIHKVVMQVDSNDAALMNLTLNNVTNVARHYSSEGQEVQIEVVAFGPGLHMLRADTSPVKARLKSIGESMPDVKFLACGNTMAGMKKAEGKDIPLLPEAKVVPGGVVHMMERQEEGWSYIRP